MTGAGDLRLRWEFYRTSAGREVVREEIHSTLDKDGTIALGKLMERISRGETFSRDVKNLGRGLLEARLTVEGREYRLYFARASHRAVLLGLHFKHKAGQASQNQAIDVARSRLSTVGV